MTDNEWSKMLAIPKTSIYLIQRRHEKKQENERLIIPKICTTEEIKLWLSQ